MEKAFWSFSRPFIVSAIKYSIDHKFLTLGQSLHALAIKTGLFPETLLCNHLINLYVKCQSFDYAQRLFEEMPEKNLISYSTLISGNSRSGKPILSLRLLSELQCHSLSPNQFVFSSSIVACSKLNSLSFGKQVHSKVIVSGFGVDPFVSASLIDMYSKLGDTDLAISIFRQYPYRDPVFFNSMVSGYVSIGAYDKALLLFREERKFVYFKPTEFSFGSILKACSVVNKEVGMQLHGLIMKSGYNSNCFVGTSLVDMYGRLGLVENLEKAFQDILSDDIALYNAVIGGYSRNNLDVIALDFFSELIMQGFTPNECTLSTALKSCAGLKSSCWGRAIHGIVLKSEFCEDIVVKTAMIDMYMKCGKVEQGCSIFDSMNERNIVSYNSMIFGLGQKGYFVQALSLYKEMKYQFVEFDPSTFVALMHSTLGQLWAVYGDVVKHGLGSNLMIRNTLLSCLIDNGLAQETLNLFNRMRERDVVSWTTVISGLVQLDLHTDATELFKQMCSSDIFPNSFTFSSVLKACGSFAGLKQGRCIHGCSFKHGIMDEFTNSSLLDMYAKCGVLEDSRRLFDEVDSKEIVFWNSMITAYAQHGLGREAIGLYKLIEEKNIDPNHVTFVSLLSACSHSGMVEDGVRLFELMVSRHSLLPLTEHYACMVYLFGRAGFLDRAKLFIDTMPFEADASVWTVFIAACKLHGNFELADLARKKLDRMLCEDKSTLVLVSNVFSEVGKWVDAEEARTKISAGGMKKEPGLSWVQTAGCIT
ncbi:hypothetical protein HPP92_004717 [Vanilla planifolia]|uniref:Pentatricopeptide repeat-containing protein n=1 Tax=Vanilla planifolia TaxID=51239 RepID=A0A835V8E0_VANPL|nr:hypothetical protein HPP92_004717 [Vanilla planifolia]